MSNMRFFKFLNNYWNRYWLSYGWLMNLLGNFQKTPEKKPWYVISIAFHLGTWVSTRDFKIHVLLFFFYRFQKEGLLFIFSIHKVLAKSSKPQQLYNRAKARSKVRKLMVLFCLNTKPVRKKDYPTLSQPWSLLIANHKGVNYFLKELIHFSPTFIFKWRLRSHNKI